MKPEALAKWEDTRSKGKSQYILLRGMLGYGLPMFIVMTFIVHKDDLNPVFIAISAVAWLIGGAAFGALTWWATERKYRKAKQGDGA